MTISKTKYVTAWLSMYCLDNRFYAKANRYSHIYSYSQMYSKPDLVRLDTIEKV